MMIQIVFTVLAFFTSRYMEAQFQSPDLNLRLNEQGHVTGDMQMFLPPLRDVTLDLYTG